jgi:hypothetical protein
MNDQQARLAGMGEAERAAAAANTPDRENGFGGFLPAQASPTNDPMQLHAAIAAMPASHQALVLQRLRMIDRIAQAIRGQTSDPVERARMAQHIAQMHPEMGVDPGMLTPQAMTDANIAALHEVATEATLSVALGKLNGERAAGGSGGTSAAGGAQVVAPISVGGANTGSLPVHRPVPRLSGASHAAQGFTILGVD